MAAAPRLSRRHVLFWTSGPTPFHFVDYLFLASVSDVGIDFPSSSSYQCVVVFHKERFFLRPLTAAKAHDCRSAGREGQALGAGVGALLMVVATHDPCIDAEPHLVTPQNNTH